MEERRMTVYKGQGAVAISFNATRFGINLSTELDYLVSVCLNATAPKLISFSFVYFCVYILFFSLLSVFAACSFFTASSVFSIDSCSAVSISYSCVLIGISCFRKEYSAMRFTI